MLLATREDFEPATDLERATALYTQYERYPFFEQRAADFNGRYAKGKMLVAGCGFGYLVDELVSRGWDAWGCDASTYAINRGKELLPAIANRLLVGDILVRNSLAAVRTSAGLSGNQRFAVTVTEDVLTMLTDAEIPTALTELRRITNDLAHVVWTLDPTTTQDPRCNWKTLAQWKAIVGTDPVMDAATGAIL